MFESPGFDMVTGAFLAGIVGVATALFIRQIENAGRRRRVASAILADMIQTLNVMIATVGHIDRLTRIKDPKNSTVPNEIVRMLRPLDRHVLSALGEGVGYLSSDALNNAVAFGGTMEAQDREMRETDFDAMKSRITAWELRNRICWALSLVGNNAEGVADDAYGWWQSMPGENRQIIDEAGELAKTGDPKPVDDKKVA